MDPLAKDDILKIIRSLQRQVADLQKMNIKSLTFPSTGTLVVPVQTADPSSPTNGQVWYNSTSHELKVRKNGTTRTITTS